LEGDSTFSSDKIASSADIYVNNYTEDCKYRSALKPEHSRTYCGGKSYAGPREMFQRQLQQFLMFQVCRVLCLHRLVHRISQDLDCVLSVSQTNIYWRIVHSRNRHSAEQVGALKMTDMILQDMKLQDMKMSDKVAGHENARHENARLEIAGRENAGHEIARHLERCT